VRLDPDFILLGLLPPLLYADAFHTSWHDFRRWLRPILMLAIGLVALTILTVGLAAHVLLPELPWAVCFTLGAVLSPTDTVAAQAVLERLRIPRRATAILGGESLVNDATGLVGVQIGVAWALTGAFELGEIGQRFAWVSGVGVVTGLAVGLLFAALNRVVKETRALFVLSLVSPYLAALVALRLDASAVLSVVTAGFFVSWRIHHIDAESRGPLYAIWDQLVFLMNGMCFVFIGTETPALLAECTRGSSTLLLAALGITLVVILTRVAWMFPAAYLPLWMFPRLREKEGGYPRRGYVVLASWCGVRGIVSLAAALALPEMLESGEPFPGRDTVVFVTLVVVLVTLLVQGWPLGVLVRKLGLVATDQGAAELRAAREAVLAAGIGRLDEFCSQTACPIAVYDFRRTMQEELEVLRTRDERAEERARQRMTVSRDVALAVHAAQSEALLRLRDEERINDLVHAELQLELDRARPAVARA
jgi:CPA1 family monovalent cation:H+ antiporter